MRTCLLLLAMLGAGCGIECPDPDFVTGLGLRVCTFGRPSAVTKDAAAAMDGAIDSSARIWRSALVDPSSVLAGWEAVVVGDRPFDCGGVSTTGCYWPDRALIELADTGSPWSSAYLHEAWHPIVDEMVGRHLGNDHSHPTWPLINYHSCVIALGKTRTSPCPEMPDVTNPS